MSVPNPQPRGATTLIPQVLLIIDIQPLSFFSLASSLAGVALRQRAAKESSPTRSRAAPWPIRSLQRLCPSGDQPLSRLRRNLLKPIENLDSGRKIGQRYALRLDAAGVCAPFFEHSRNLCLINDKNLARELINLDRRPQKLPARGRSRLPPRRAAQQPFDRSALGRTNPVGKKDHVACALNCAMWRSWLARRLGGRLEFFQSFRRRPKGSCVQEGLKFARCVNSIHNASISEKRAGSPGRPRPAGCAR